MGVWNSHTSVGNILGSLIAGSYVSSNWGMSFIVPGIVIAAMGVVCFLFLIERTYRSALLAGVGRQARGRGLQCCGASGEWLMKSQRMQSGMHY